MYPHLLELPAHDAEVVERGADEAELAAGNGGRHREHGSVDPVRHHRVLDRGQFPDTLDRDEAGAAAADLRAHLAQERDHVLNLGLLGGVVDDGHAGRERGGHDQVLGAGVRRGVEVQVRSAQAVGLDADLALALVDGGAQPGEAAVVEVQVAAAEVAPADALEHRLAEPVQQRGNEQHGRAELPGDLGGQHRAGQLGGVDHQRPLHLVELDHRADGLGKLDGPADVLDDRDVPQHRAALLGQQRGGDHLQRRVLSALDENGPLQGIAAYDAVAGLVTAAHNAETPVPGGRDIIIPARGVCADQLRPAKAWVRRRRPDLVARSPVFHCSLTPGR